MASSVEMNHQADFTLNPVMACTIQYEYIHGEPTEGAKLHRKKPLHKLNV